MVSCLVRTLHTVEGGGGIGANWTGLTVDLQETFVFFCRLIPSWRLLNPRVRHDGTDLNDPFFDVYQDVQHQNDYATMQLNIMGNSGDVL